MVNFFNDAKIPAIDDLLTPIVKTLLSVFQAGPVYVQEQIFATLGG